MHQEITKQSFVLLFVLCMAASAVAANPEAERLLRLGEFALHAWHMKDARIIAKRLEAVAADDADVLFYRARVRYYLGDYAGAYALIQQIEKIGRLKEPHQRLLAILKTLLPTSRQFVEKESEHFSFKCFPKDAILIRPALETLEKAYKRVGSDLDYFPKEKVLVEVYPDVHSFMVASTLKRSEIENSGTVAICHANRIMIMSPRLVLRGYPWLNTLCHEYTHYVIVQKTANTVPIWLHEGIAKYEETRWQGDIPFRLTPALEALLADAIERDEFVSFEKMHPSLAKLNFYEGQLAFAQVYTIIEFLKRHYDDGVISRILQRARSCRGPQSALAAETGLSPEQLLTAWKDWLKRLKLEKIPGLRVPPPTLEPKSETTLAEIESSKARDFTLIADMLRQESLHKAALVEYHKALDSSDALCPDILNRIASACLEARDLDKCERALARARRFYPDYTTTYVNLGRLCRAKGNLQLARQNLEHALSLNPFDIIVRSELVEVYNALGMKDEATKERYKAIAVAEALFGKRASVRETAGPSKNSSNGEAK